jgi:hypothetical protein
VWFPVAQSDVAMYLEHFRKSELEFGITVDDLKDITGLAADTVAIIAKGLAPKPGTTLCVLPAFVLIITVALFITLVSCVAA